VQELGALDAVSGEVQRFYRLGLGRLQQCQQLHNVQRHVAVVIGRLAQHVAARRYTAFGSRTVFGVVGGCSPMPTRAHDQPF